MQTPSPDDDPGATQDLTVRGKGFKTAALELFEARRRRVVPGEQLGAGSMGVVRSAWQTSVHREVAIKAPKTNHPAEVASVLQEAWVAGVLEHPNIVPVYDIEPIDGVPHVVMKKLDGDPWTELIDDPDLVHRTFGRYDTLNWNLEVLIAVCHAIELAHSKGILHRDLKPANVVIGRYGEVWVVDWGLAVSLTDDHADRLPLARDQTTVAGTPAYMAPETAQARADLLGAPADVYLLGGLLYRIVAGRPPHQGGPREAMDAAVYEPVSIDPAWPLASLMEQALTKDPSKRIQSVETFRKGIQAYLADESVRQLLERGEQRLEALQQAVAVPTDDSESRRTRIYNTYNSCRYALSEALDSPSLHERALRGLREASLAMVDYEIGVGDDRAAALMLAQVDDPPPHLEPRIDQLREQREAAQERLVALEADVDPRTAAWVRLGIGVFIGSIWVLTPVTSVLLGLQQGYARELFIAGTTFVFTLFTAGVAAPWVIRSRLNRLIIPLVVISPGLAFLLDFGFWLRGEDSQLAGTVEIFVYFTTCLVATIAGDWRLIVPTLGYLCAYFLAMANPGTTLLWLNIANVIIAISIAVLWGPGVLRQTLTRQTSD